MNPSICLSIYLSIICIYLSVYLSQVVDLIEFSLCQCPAVQCEVLYSAVPRLIGGMLQARRKSMLLDPHVTRLQSLITERVTQLVEGAEDSKVAPQYHCLVYRELCHFLFTS